MDADVRPARELDELLLEILEQPVTQWTAALEKACRRHPELAAPLRRRFSYLQRTGLAAGDGDRHPAILVPGQRFGPYELRAIVGAGGMGVVYRARRAGLDRDVALKVLRTDFVAHAGARARFLREAAASARIDHPALCTVYDFGEHAGLPYLAMRFLRGETLTTAIARARRSARVSALFANPEPPGLRTMRRLAALFVPLAEGLDEAHRHGLVHRDVKPDNIVIEAGDRLVLIDFGLARDADATRLTRSGEPLGTPAYMAPEQVLGLETDPRTDVHALAATLYECVTLRPPFEVAGRDALYRAILEQDVVDARKRNPEVPHDLAVVLQKALQKEPQHRYETMREFADDLQRVTHGDPVRARPVPALRRLLHLVRRHPLRAASVVMAAFGLLAIWLVQVAAAQRARAESDRARAESEAVAASTGALLMRDPTVAALIGRAAFLALPDSVVTRSHFLLAMARNRQVAEWRAGSLVAGVFRSPDSGFDIALAGGVWLRDQRDSQQWKRVHGVPSGSQLHCASWARDGGSFLVGGTAGTLLRFAHDGSRLPLSVEAFAGTWWGERYGTVLRTMPLIDALGGEWTGGFVAGDRDGCVVLVGGDGNERARFRVSSAPDLASALLVKAVDELGAILIVDTAGRVWSWAIATAGAGAERTLLYDCQTRVSFADVSDDQRLLALGDEHGRIHIVHLDGTTMPTVLLDALPRHPDVLELAADGSHLFAAALGKHWALWRLGSEPQLLDKTRHDLTVRSAALSPAADYVVFGDNGGRIVIRQVTGPRSITLQAHQDLVNGLRFVGDRRFVTWSHDGTVKEWRLDVPGLPVLERHNLSVLSVSWLDERHLLTTSTDGSLWTGDVDGNDGLAWALLDEPAPLKARPSPDGTLVAAASRNALVHLWRREASGALRPVPPVQARVAVELAWLAGVLVVGENGGLLRLVDLSDRSERQLALPKHASVGQQARCTCVSTSPDGRHVAAAWQDGSGLWRVDGNWLGPLAESGAVAIAFTADSEQILIGFLDGRLELRTLTGVLVQRFEGGLGGIGAVGVSPDGGLVAALANDRVLHVWTIDGEPWLELPHDALTHSLAFSPDGNRIAVGCSDGSIRIWPLTHRGIESLAGSVFRDLTADERSAYLGESR